MQGNVDKHCKTLISVPGHEFGELQEVSSGMYDYQTFRSYWLIQNSGIYYPWDPILGRWRELAPSPCLDVPGWLLCGLSCFSYQGCLHVGHSLFQHLRLLS